MRSGGRRRCRALAGWCCLLASGSRQASAARAGAAAAAAAASFWGQRKNHQVDGVGNCQSQQQQEQEPPSPWSAPPVGGRRRSADLASSGAAFSSQQHHDPRSSFAAASSAADVAADLESGSSSAASSTAADDGTAPAIRRPERGKVLTELTPQQMYDAYRDIQRDYQARAFSTNDGGNRHHHPWRILNERDGVQVALLQHPDDPHCPYVRMCGVIDAPVQECWNFLMVDRWDESMPKMDPFYEGVTIVGQYSHPESGVDMTLCRKRTRRILAFGKRDLVFLSVVDKPLHDGTWASGSVSVVTPHVPRQPGYTRAFQDSIAFYQPLDNNTRTNLTIVCRIDLNDSGQDGSGGWIPMWLYVKTIGVTAVESVLRMRHAIVGGLPKMQMQMQQNDERKQ